MKLFLVRLRCFIDGDRRLMRKQSMEAVVGEIKVSEPGVGVECDHWKFPSEVVVGEIKVGEVFVVPHRWRDVAGKI